MNMIKTYKYKIKPNEEQRQLMAQFFGCVRFIYNWGLDIKTKSYKENGKSPSYNDLAKQLTDIKKTEELKWLNDCPTVALQQSLRNLENAFTGFFRKKSKYPRFKSKKKSRDSVKFINSVHFDFEKWRVKLPKLGWINLCKNMFFDISQCKQGTVTVSKDKCNEYWITVVIDDLLPKRLKTKIVKDTAVGIDLGIKDFAILSNGVKVPNPKYYENKQKELARLQKAFAKTKTGSNRHEKARIKVARCYRKVSNMRNDMLHKLTTYLVECFDTICLEDLNITGMKQNHNLAKSIQSASWGEFVRQLQYKSEWFGKNVVFIGQYDPSSKLCHNCGYINKDLKLSDREWICPECGTKHDRDVNAAINIRNIAFEKQNLIGL